MIDVVFLILMALAIYKGYSKGFIIAIFSILGFIIALAAALKLSSTIALKLSEHSNFGKWLPPLSFLLVFIAAAFCIKLLGNVIQKLVETILLGWANRIAGVLLYALLYSIIFSIFIFYAVQLNLLQISAMNASIVYPYLQPLGPKVIEGLGTIIPWFKNMFASLENFFGKFATK